MTAPSLFDQLRIRSNGVGSIAVLVAVVVAWIVSVIRRAGHLGVLDAFGTIAALSRPV